MPESEIRRIFVKNLNAIMERRGVTQTDLSRALNVSVSTAHDWCTGKKIPRIDKIQIIADFLHVDMEYLYSREDLSSLDDQDRLEALHQNPRLGMLFDRQRKMSESDIDFMMQMADRILRERDRDE